MSRAVHVASGTGNVQAVTAGSNTVVGLTVAAGAAAIVRVYDGTSTAGAEVAVAQLGAAGTVHVQVPAVNVEAGVYVERSAAAEVVVYLL